MANKNNVFQTIIKGPNHLNWTGVSNEKLTNFLTKPASFFIPFPHTKSMNSLYLSHNSCLKETQELFFLITTPDCISAEGTLLPSILSNFRGCQRLPSSQKSLAKSTSSLPSNCFDVGLPSSNSQLAHSLLQTIISLAHVKTAIPGLWPEWVESTAVLQFQFVSFQFQQHSEDQIPQLSTLSSTLNLLYVKPRALQF